jgi:hypothetical protein
MPDSRITQPRERRESINCISIVSKFNKIVPFSPDSLKKKKKNKKKQKKKKKKKKKKKNLVVLTGEHHGDVFLTKRLFSLSVIAHGNSAPSLKKKEKKKKKKSISEFK